MAYRERLSVPVSWWLLGIVAVAALWLAYDVAIGPAVAVPVALLALGGVATGLVGYGRLTVRVDGAGLGVGAAHLPAWAVGTVEVLDSRRAGRVQGRDADPRAYYVLRGYVHTAVRVWVNDPDDPVPYWVVSTRRPEALARALTSPRLSSRGDVAS